MVLGDNFLEFSNPKTIIYNIKISHINFIQNEHVKLAETRIVAQGNLKAYLSNALDVLGFFTSKLHEDLKTSYSCYINSFNNLTTSLNTHKHIEQYNKHLGDLVVESLSRPLMFDFRHL